MPGRQQIPSFQLPSGTTTERDAHSNIGNIFYNTDTSNVEIYHEDPSNNAAWRDLGLVLKVNSSNHTTISNANTTPTDGTHPVGDYYYSITNNNSGGNPPAPPNSSGRMGIFETSITLRSPLQKVLINGQIFGEWSRSGTENTGIVIERKIDSNYSYIRAEEPNLTNPDNLRTVSMFSIGYADFNADSTMEMCFINIVDDLSDTSISSYPVQIFYTPVLVHAHGSTSTHYFALNRVLNSSPTATGGGNERAMSSFQVTSFIPTP